ncbi:MAG: DUF2784 domain-containing protein [Candidatus Krumholzibacteriia bacterium]
MLARLAADLVMVVHFAFIAFVVAGGLAVVRRPRLALLHLPCALYGAAIEFGGWVCPLTPLEIRLRQAAGTDGYTGGFIDHYLAPVVYPPGLTREAQLVLGGAVLLVNLVVYGLAVRRWRKAGPK